MVTIHSTLFHRSCGQACYSAETAYGTFHSGKLLQIGLGISLGQKTMMPNSEPKGGKVGDKSCSWFMFMSLWWFKTITRDIVDTDTASWKAHALRNTFTIHFILLQSKSITDFSVKENFVDLQEITRNDRTVELAFKHGTEIKCASAYMDLISSDSTTTNVWMVLFEHSRKNWFHVR